MSFRSLTCCLVALVLVHTPDRVSANELFLHMSCLGYEAPVPKNQDVSELTSGDVDRPIIDGQIASVHILAESGVDLSRIDLLPLRVSVYGPSSAELDEGVLSAVAHVSFLSPKVFPHALRTVNRVTGARLELARGPGDAQSSRSAGPTVHRAVDVCPYDLRLAAYTAKTAARGVGRIPLRQAAPAEALYRLGTGWRRQPRRLIEHNAEHDVHLVRAVLRLEGGADEPVTIMRAENTHEMRRLLRGIGVTGLRRWLSPTFLRLARAERREMRAARRR